MQRICGLLGLYREWTPNFNILGSLESMNECSYCLTINQSDHNQENGEYGIEHRCCRFALRGNQLLYYERQDSPCRVVEVH